jgi:hypothetical protein
MELSAWQVKGEGRSFLWPVTDAGVGRRRRRAEWKESENSAPGKGLDRHLKRMLPCEER